MQVKNVFLTLIQSRLRKTLKGFGGGFEVSSGDSGSILGGDISNKGSKMSNVSDDDWETMDFRYVSGIRRCMKK